MLRIITLLLAIVAVSAAQSRKLQQLNLAPLAEALELPPALEQGVIGGVLGGLSGAQTGVAAGLTPTFVVEFAPEAELTQVPPAIVAGTVGAEVGAARGAALGAELASNIITGPAAEEAILFPAPGIELTPVEAGAFLGATVGGAVGGEVAQATLVELLAPSAE